MIENHIYLDLIIVKNLKKMDYFYFYLYNFFIFIYIYLKFYSAQMSIEILQVSKISSAQMSTNVSAQMSIHTFSKSAQMSFAHYYINNSQVTADEK